MIIKCSLNDLMQFEITMCNIIDRYFDYLGDEDVDMLKIELKNEFKTFIICCVDNAETYLEDMIE